MSGFRGKTAVVTGGGSGIGRALAKALAAEGAAVAVVDILLENAERVVAEIVAEGGTAAAFLCDVSERASVLRMKQAVNEVLGHVALLFANAGATSFERLIDMSEADVDWILQVNLNGVVNCVMAFYPDMVERGEGHLFVTSSSAGLIPALVPYHAAYAAAKMGVIGFLLNLRIEAAERNIGCTVLCPGGVESGMRENNGRYRPERFGGPEEGGVRLPEGFFQRVSLRFRGADEVARLCLAAVAANQPVVVTDSAMEEAFSTTYTADVLEAFAALRSFDQQLEREQGGSAAVEPGGQS